MLRAALQWRDFVFRPGLNCLNDSQCAKRSRINHSRTENDGKIFKPLELLDHDRGKSVLWVFYPIFRIKLFHSNENVSSIPVSESVSQYLPTFVCSSSFLSGKATPGPEILKGRWAAARLRVELEMVENMMTSLCSQLYSDLSHHTSLPVLSSSQKQTEITRNPLWSKEMTWKFPKV